jgi:hypothetical protein
LRQRQLIELANAGDLPDLLQQRRLILVGLSHRRRGKFFS